MTINLALPEPDEAGQVRRWYLPLREAGARDDEYRYHVTYARFLGMGTSHTASHTASVPHPDGFVARGVRCNACRWFEARLFRELLLPPGVDDVAELAELTSVVGESSSPRARLGGYVLHSVGMSVVPDEVPFCRVEETTSSFSVVELMTTRRVTEQGPQAFIAKPAAYALAEASARDSDLADAYVNRAVS